ncbi:hypothetical protein WN943_028640 [Citrus x changshan-huyou]
MKAIISLSGSHQHSRNNPITTSLFHVFLPSNNPSATVASLDATSTFSLPQPPHLTNPDTDQPSMTSLLLQNTYHSLVAQFLATASGVMTITTISHQPPLHHHDTSQLPSLPTLPPPQPPSSITVQTTAATVQLQIHSLKHPSHNARNPSPNPPSCKPITLTPLFKPKAKSHKKIKYKHKIDPSMEPKYNIRLSLVILTHLFNSKVIKYKPKPVTLSKTKAMPTNLLKPPMPVLLIMQLSSIPMLPYGLLSHLLMLFLALKPL